MTVHSADYGACCGPAAAERVRQRFGQDAISDMARLARSVRDFPDEVSTSDKLRNVANWIDVNDAEHGRAGTDAQDFLRGLAACLERPTFAAVLLDHLDNCPACGCSRITFGVRSEGVCECDATVMAVLLIL